ncbi:cholesterol 24-hydroxylase-like isoform X2 [Amphiura filiformis]|uniref:cholesterol 24-hydroxylase-like isoform X2 n=1 Tax=Amphiura filiformis TaxID=82378 RepID=UPI003B20F4D9
MAVSTLGVVYIAIACVVLVAILAVACFALYLHFFVHRKYRHIPGPPRDSFFLGNLPAIFEYYENGKMFADAITDWTAEYGPIIVVYLMNQVMIAANSPEAIKEFVISNGHPKSKHTYQDNVGYIYGSPLMGKSLVTEIDHEVWMRKRAICDPAFHRKSLRSSMNQFNSCGDLLVQKLSTMADGKTEVVLLDQLNRVALDIIAKIGFGLDLNVLFQEKSKFNEAVVTVLEAMDYNSKNPWDKYNPSSAMREYRQKARDACRLLREAGRECVQKRLQSKSNGETLPDDVMTLMMEAEERFEDLDGDADWTHIMDEFATFFIAGQETTANTLAFAFVELLQHPEIMHRLRTEIDAVIGDNTDIKFEDLSKLCYTSAIIKETLRIYPPAICTVRDCAFDTTLHGITIPKGATVTLFPYVTGRLESNFKDPLVFVPDRFLHQQETPPNTYFPFSVGPRSCIGKQFAMIEAKVLIAKLLKNFDFRLVPGQSYQVVQGGTIRPMDGCMVYINHRDAEIGDAVFDYHLEEK